MSMMQRDSRQEPRLPSAPAGPTDREASSRLVTVSGPIKSDNRIMGRSVRLRIWHGSPGQSDAAEDVPKVFMTADW